MILRKLQCIIMIILQERRDFNWFMKMIIIHGIKDYFFHKLYSLILLFVSLKTSLSNLISLMIGKTGIADMRNRGKATISHSKI